MIRLTPLDGRRCVGPSLCRALLVQTFRATHVHSIRLSRRLAQIAEMTRESGVRFIHNPARVVQFYLVGQATRRKHEKSY